jgi:hypothetical protein
MTDNVFDMAEYKARKAEREMPYVSDFEARLLKVKASFERINRLFAELKGKN